MADTPNGNGRLDSWKAIAAYLNRDERTVRRWERDSGLPVRRVPGGRGASVFAYASEIDDWLRTSQDAGMKPEAEPQPARRGWLVAAGLAIAMAAAGWTWLSSSRISSDDLRLEAGADGVVAFDHQGAERWRYRFDPAYKTILADGDGVPAVIVGGPNAAAYVATSYRARNGDGQTESGSLAELAIDGRPLRAFQFTDQVTVDGKAFAGPWAMAAFAVDDRDGRRRIAVAAHHHMWSASLVTVLDDSWQRLGTFVHAGWIESVRWLPGNRLLVGGYSDEHEGGLIGVLDPDALAGAPLRMYVMPRTELNRVTVSRFNRAVVQVTPDRIVARPIEVPSAGQDAVDVLYEFTSQLEFTSAAFSARYWELHRALEAQGQLNHAREACPDRDGPRTIKRWLPAEGWRVIAIS